MEKYAVRAAIHKIAVGCNRARRGSWFDDAVSAAIRSMAKMSATTTTVRHAIFTLSDPLIAYPS